MPLLSSPRRPPLSPDGDISPTPWGDNTGEAFAELPAENVRRFYKKSPVFSLPRTAGQVSRSDGGANATSASDYYTRRGGATKSSGQARDFPV